MGRSNLKKSRENTYFLHLAEKTFLFLMLKFVWNLRWRQYRDFIQPNNSISLTSCFFCTQLLSIDWSPGSWCRESTEEGRSFLSKLMVGAKKPLKKFLQVTSNTTQNDHQIIILVNPLIIRRHFLWREFYHNCVLLFFSTIVRSYRERPNQY